MSMDIRIRIIFPSSADCRYNWRDFETVFGELEQIAYQLDRDLVFLLSRQLHVRDLERDAALERLRRYRNRRVLISEIRPGSWEIFVFFAAAAGVVLGKTVGEAINDGFRETKFRQELKDFARVSGDWLLLKLTDKLRSSKEFFKARIERKETEVLLLLPGPKEDENRLPTWKEFLDGDRTH